MNIRWLSPRKRKAYGKLLDWKKQYADRYAVLLEGARRVGKSTIAEQFAINEYKSYILIDFSKVSDKLPAIEVKSSGTGKLYQIYTGLYDFLFGK